MPGSLSFNTSITYNVLERGGENYNRWDYSLYSSYLLKNNFRQQAGWQYKNHAQNGKQIGFFVESNWRFWKFGDMALKLEQNYYRDQISYKRQDFDQLKLTFRLDKKI